MTERCMYALLFRIHFYVVFWLILGFKTCQTHGWRRTKEDKRAMRPLYNNQTPPRANKTKKKYYGFLHRGKPCILQILSMQKCFLKNVSASYTFSVSLKFANFSLNILRKYILVKKRRKRFMSSSQEGHQIDSCPQVTYFCRICMKNNSNQHLHVPYSSFRIKLFRQRERLRGWNIFANFDWVSNQ